MPTRSGRTFSVGEIFSPMDPNFKNTLNTLIVRMDKIDRRLQEFKDPADANCNDLATRFDRLETNRKRITYPLEENESRANNRSPRYRQAQPYNIRTQMPNILKV